MRFRGRPGISLVGVVPLLLVAACSTKPDVVAEQLPAKDDAATPFWTPDSDGTKCTPGHYEGAFNSAPSSTTIPLNGTFSFDLEAPLKGEFHQLADNAKLLGTTSSAFEFKATITGSADCGSEKLFKSKIENGEFSIPGGGTLIRFHGNVDGQYNMTHFAPVFTGAWQVYRTPGDGGVADAQGSTEQFLTGGTWFASLVP